MARRVAVVSLGCLVLGAGLLGGTTMASADAFDPTTLCPSASPSAAVLNGVYDSVAASDRASAAGFSQKVTTDLQGEAVKTTYTYDKAADLAQWHMAIGGDAVATVILDPQANHVYELARHESYDDPETLQSNIGLAELGVTSVWVAAHEDITDHDLLDEAGGWVDLASVPATGPFGDGKLSTKADYTCTVSDHTQSVSDGTSTWQLTVDDQGRATGIDVDATDPDFGHYTQTGTASYDGSVTVTKPKFITATTLDNAIVRGFVKKLKPEIVDSALDRFAKDHTHATRVASLRAAAKSKVAAMLHKYNSDTEMKLTRKDISNGVRVTLSYRDPFFDTHSSGYVNLKVDGKHVISSYHLPG